MEKNLKLKDLVLVALLLVIYMAIYMLAFSLSGILGAFGHAISPGIGGLLNGPVLYFLHVRLGKRWVFTIFSALVMAVFTLMGAGYIPWIITTMVGAILADIVCWNKDNLPVYRLATGSGLMHVGQAFGSIIPANFFLEAYRATYIAKGMSPADIDQSIYYTKGIMGLLATLVTFILAFIGIYIGHKVLEKHLNR